MTEKERKMRAEIADELGKLDDELRPIKPKLERQAALRALVQNWYAHEDPEDSFVVFGADYVVDVGPKARERKIKSMLKVKSFFGLKRFIQICQVRLKDLDAFVPEPERSKLTTTAATGPRKVTSQAIASRAVA